jgi:hypothetical protein
MILLFLFLASLCNARTLVVATDSTGQYSAVGLAALDAVAGDSILVRDGVYPDAPISIDSGVVVYAEHPGSAAIACGGFLVSGIVLHQTAQLLGLGILGDPTSTHQELLEIRGGPATIYNCSFEPASHWGLMMKFFCNGNAPMIRQCNLDNHGTGSLIAYNYDSTSIWMPGNYYGSLDTVIIHREIRDSTNIVGGFGHVYISPVLDQFNWLETQDRPHYAEAVPQLTVYPNPSRGGIISLNIQQPRTVERLEIYNLLGQSVRSFNRSEVESIMNHGAQARLDLPLAVGTYFIVVTNPQFRQTAKIAIVH